ncbi:hypothetical protein CRV08_09705 [Halarcobacter ebronensis]|uniref:Uncharacterized protein n=1 Tax=Halarcobacter ebronensis TaxID=1462615 RepID=A0A4Q0YCC8_9BACT|nr:hypothetical protein [Halarcobacter ebronensis]RXJ67635.1 hypothetical protein CRV08_09705 [Halarcobacter ebronensis]
MSKIGFDAKNEFLPSFDMFHSNVNKRVMFLKLFNQDVPSSMKFSKEELKECKKFTLIDMFINKILKNLQQTAYIESPLVSVDAKLTNKINSFLKENNLSSIKARFTLKNSLEETSIETAKKLISLLENCNYSFFLDGEKTFKSFVVGKILRSNQQREVFINSDSIDIKSSEFASTKIFTFWELINSKKLNIEEHIDKAIKCIKTLEFKQVYLVYPKNENFNRHIQIKCDELEDSEYMIKLIPYSMRSTLR